jgi:hypothetical protein
MSTRKNKLLILNKKISLPSPYILLGKEGGGGWGGMRGA